MLLHTIINLYAHKLTIHSSHISTYFPTKLELLQSPSLLPRFDFFSSNVRYQCCYQPLLPVQTFVLPVPRRRRRHLHGPLLLPVRRWWPPARPLSRRRRARCGRTAWRRERTDKGEEMVSEERELFG